MIRAGLNYGWPVITYGVNYGIGTRIGEGARKEGMEQPLYYWVPSIAPSGMAFYTGDRFPRWKGNLFVGACATRCSFACNGEKVVKEERLLKGVRTHPRRARRARRLDLCADRRQPRRSRPARAGRLILRSPGLLIGALSDRRGT